jgi:hypothetical protein
MEDEKQTAGLLAKDFSMKEIGPSLIKKAEEQGREETQKAIVGQVQGIMSDVHRKQQMIVNLQESIKHQQERLKALDGGDFRIEYSFDRGAWVIQYNDATLQVDL